MTKSINELATDWVLFYWIKDFHKMLLLNFACQLSIVLLVERITITWLKYKKIFTEAKWKIKNTLEDRHSLRKWITYEIHDFVSCRKLVFDIASRMRRMHTFTLRSHVFVGLGRAIGKYSICNIRLPNKVSLINTS